LATGHAASRAALWRLHALAALLASPFLIVAALTGLVYVAAPQVEAWQHGHLDRVRPAPWRPLDALVATAQAAAPPGHVVQHVVPPAEPGQSLRVRLAPHHRAAAAEHAHADADGPVDVFVDPGTGAVLGVQPESERFSHWAKNLHARLLQGEGWRWAIEWAATCLLVMLLSGVALAWPVLGSVLRPATGRAAWRRWHLGLGVALAGLSLVIVLTGLTWSQTAGGQIRALRDATGQAPPRMPKDLRSEPLAAGASVLGWDAVWAQARREAPSQRLQIAPPRGATGVWRIGTPDRDRPWDRVDLALHAQDGRVLWRSTWSDQTAFGKATALGIPFHRGEFGLWNQALLAVFGLGVLVSVVTGWALWWRRRAAGGPVLLRPKAWAGVRWRWPALAAALALCALVPLLAAFVTTVLLLEVPTRSRA
jgi:uncharacterized iron-regulated membrane protein